MWYRRLAAVSAVLAVGNSSFAAEPPPASPNAIYNSIRRDPAPVATPEVESILVDDLQPARPKVWAEADYLLWFERRQRVPLLVGTLPDSMVNTADRQSSPANPLYPTNGRIDFGAISGLSARVGCQLSDRLGLDFGGFVLERSSIERSFASPGSPSLVRTYILPATGVLQNLFSAKIDPNGYPGSVRVDADTRFWGIDGNARTPWYTIFADRNDLLAGFRYLDLQENLGINDRSDLGGGRVVNTVSDNFHTQNRIYVAQIGLQSYFAGSGRFDLGYSAKFGVGGASQRVDISGSNTLTGLPDERTGLYSQATNIGSYERSKLVAVGEIGFKLGYGITERVRAQVGYNILYVSSVVRPGLALDSAVNDANIRYVANPTPDAVNRRPAFDFGRASSDFYSQGLTVGLSIGY